MEEIKVTRDTKEEILITALHRFARDGYEAVSVSQIAGDLGITKGALYRHYKNKRDIFDHIVARMEQGDSDHAESHDMPEGDKESMPEKYEEVSLDDFVQYSRSMFEYWTEDDFASSFRKLLVVEQFRSAEMQALYQQYLVAGPVGYVKDLLKSLGIKGAKKKAVHTVTVCEKCTNCQNDKGHDSNYRTNVIVLFVDCQFIEPCNQKVCLTCS